MPSQDSAVSKRGDERMCNPVNCDMRDCWKLEMFEKATTAAGGEKHQEAIGDIRGDISWVTVWLQFLKKLPKPSGSDHTLSSENQNVLVAALRLDILLNSQMCNIPLKMLPAADVKNT